MSFARYAWVIGTGCALLGGCGGGPDEATGGGGSTSTSGSGGTAGMAGSGGSGGAGGTSSSGGAGGRVVDACAGLVTVPFQDAPLNATLGATASDVTVPTRDGDYHLKDRWTGCDSYLFIQDAPKQNAGWPIGIWERDLPELLKALPKNVELFFVSVNVVDSEREAALDALSAKADEALAGLSAEDAEHFKARIHYVTAPAGSLPGFLGALLSDPGWGVAIDRAQRIRFIGSYADVTRYDSSKSWFAPSLAMAANEATLYNFEADRQARLDKEKATVVDVFSAEVVSDPNGTGVMSFADVTLPGAAEMAKFDTLELDLSLGCEGEREFGDCPTGGEAVTVSLCDAVDPSKCADELGRFIAPFQREGRWVLDASGQLPWLKDGGARRLAVHSKDAYEVTLSLRLSSAGKGARPVESMPLWAGEVLFDAKYNDAFQPATVNIPAGAKKVEIWTTITGRGVSPPGACAELCDTTHTFYVNGKEHKVSFPETESQTGCMDQTASGVVPNQYGTWWYGRAGYCPGKDVTAKVMDITADVTIGGQALIDYEGFYKGAPYTGKGAFIRMNAALVLSQ